MDVRVKKQRKTIGWREGKAKYIQVFQESSPEALTHQINTFLDQFPLSCVLDVYIHPFGNDLLGTVYYVDPGSVDNMDPIPYEKNPK